MNPFQIPFEVSSSATYIVGSKNFFLHRIVKLSSPNLNYILILGSVILYTDMFLIVFYYTGFDKLAKQTALCNVCTFLLYNTTSLIYLYIVCHLVSFIWICTLFLCNIGKVWKSLLHLFQSKYEEKGQYA